MKTVKLEQVGDDLALAGQVDGSVAVEEAGEAFDPASAAVSKDVYLAATSGQSYAGLRPLMCKYSDQKRGKAA